MLPKKQPPKYGSVSDGTHNYKTLKVNNSTWLAENLKTEVFDSWVYDNDEKNAKKFGRLYTLKAANRACAKLGPGWRLPGKRDWEALILHYGGLEDYTTGTKVYKSHGKSSKTAFLDLRYNDMVGFFFELGGNSTRKVDDRPIKFNGLHTRGMYWSREKAPDNSNSRVYYKFDHMFTRVTKYKTPYNNGMSCRCVKSISNKW